MKHYLLFIMVVLPLTCLAQSTTLTGRVLDATTKEALPGVIIRNQTLGDGTTTDFDGAFNLKVTVGDSVSFDYVGYQMQGRRISAEPLREPLQVLLQQEKNELSVVVVSAGKFEQNVSEVTVSMEVLRPELLRDKNVISADEALQQTPGVSIVDKEPQIRSGSGYSFGAGSRVQILVDDLPILSGDAGKPAWDYLPVENVSQVEVIKGASSVLYGSSALSGVINLRTAYPADTARTVVTAYHGFYSKPQNTESVYWEGNLQRSGINFLHLQKFGQLDVTLAGNVVGDDGHLGPIRDTVNGAIVNGYNPFTSDRYAANSRARLNVNLRYRSRKISGLSYGINSNWNTSNSLATLVWENSVTGLYGAYEGSATRTRQLLGTIDPFVTYFSKQGNKHALRGRWQSLDNNNDNNQGNFSDQFYGEYQYQHRWAGIKDMTTTVGVVSIYTKARGELFSGGNANGRNTAENYAGFFQVDKKFFNRLNVSAGLRYEYFRINEEDDAKPVFRTGANYQLGKATYVRASYGQGYRFPSIAEKFIITGVGAINIFANPDLIAETSDNMEVGIKQGFRIGKLYGFADVAVFRQYYENFIEFTFGLWKPITNFEQANQSFGFKSLNTGRALIRGAEFSIMGAGDIGKNNFQFLAGYTFTDPKTLTPNLDYYQGSEELQGTSPVSYVTTSSDTTNYILKYRMQHLVRADIAWRRGALNAGFSARYNSHMQNIDKIFTDLEQVPSVGFNPGLTQWRAEHTTGDIVFDCRVAYTIRQKHRLAVVVNNLLNREYAIRPLAIEQPRHIMLQYTLTL